MFQLLWLRSVLLSSYLVDSCSFNQFKNSGMAISNLYTTISTALELEKKYQTPFDILYHYISVDTLSILANFSTVTREDDSVFLFLQLFLPSQR